MVKILGLLIAALLTYVPLVKVADGGSPRGDEFSSIVGASLGRDRNEVKLHGASSRKVAGQSGRPSSQSDSPPKGGSRSHIAAEEPAVVEALLTTACANGAECFGRQANGLNPFFPGAPTPAPTPSALVTADAPAAPRVVTIEDVARFLPAQVTLHAEPDGWAVVGVPANFWTRVVPVTVQGQLLGEQAAVRFTPRIYEWRYGDGSIRTTTTGGSSWAGAGQEELTPTPTSHQYAAKAAVQATVTVYWSAEYRFAGSDWIGVAGAVSSASPEQRMLVVKERTVLTAR